MGCRCASEPTRPPAGPMIRIQARVIRELIVFTLSRNGVRGLTTTNVPEAADWLRMVHVKDPMPLLKAAAQWGAVEIHGEAVRIRRGSPGEPENLISFQSAERFAKLLPSDARSPGRHSSVRPIASANLLSTTASIMAANVRPVLPSVPPYRHRFRSSRCCTKVAVARTILGAAVSPRRRRGIH